MSGAWTNPNAPNLTDFTSFIYNTVGIPTTALPTGSPWIGYAFNQATAIVAVFPVVAPIETVLATYNCGAHILIKIAPDQAGQTYFVTLRGPGPGGFSLASPQLGMISASSDESTSNTYATPESFTRMTLGDLDFMRTPWGRDYLAYVQSYGPSIWGLT